MAPRILVMFTLLVLVAPAGVLQTTPVVAQEDAQTTTTVPSFGEQDVGQEQEEIVQQGTVTSEPDPVPGHEQHQYANILPIREDGSVYSGVLTFTASRPVEVVVLNIQNLNSTEQQMLNATTDEFGTLLTAQLPDQINVAVNLITPDYGTSPVPTASIPFVGNGLLFHTLSGEPFTANYALHVRVLPSEMANTIRDLPETQATAATP